MTSTRWTNRNSTSIRHAGFSLTEVVIVMLVLGILAAVAIPKYQDTLARRSLQSATNRLAADIRVARSNAMTKSEDRSITVDPSGSTYHLDNHVDVNSANATYSVNLTDVPYKSSIVSSTYDKEQLLIFNGFGLPNVSGQITLRSGRFSQQVSVAATGAVESQTMLTDSPVTGSMEVE